MFNDDITFCPDDRCSNTGCMRNQKNIRERAYPHSYFMEIPSDCPIKHETISYTSSNGYRGVLYGKSSYAIYDKTGREVFHTGFRAFNSYDELKRQVDDFPNFINMLAEYAKEWKK